MPSLSPNTFIELTASQGTARVNAATLPSGDYDPCKDFYPSRGCGFLPARIPATAPDPVLEALTVMNGESKRLNIPATDSTIAPSGRPGPS